MPYPRHENFENNKNVKISALTKSLRITESQR